jgi:hypothetical protein
MIVDGKHYDLDGTPREQPKDRVAHATAAMRACSEEVRGVERAFDRDARPAVLALAASVAHGDTAVSNVSFATLPASGPLVWAAPAPTPAPQPPPKAKPKAKAKTRVKAVAAGAAAPVEPAISALSISLRAALDATEHCSAANLAAVKAVWDEQHYISQPETHDLLEAHWEATQRLARAKEIAMTSMALSLAAAEAGRGRPAPLASTARVLESRSGGLFADVPFVHDVRREVLVQALRDTSGGCGGKDEGGKTTCDKILGAFKTVQTAAAAVDDAKAGRVFAMLEKASTLAEGDGAAERREQARREAVLPLIPETPALDRSGAALAAAREGDVHHARLRGLSIAASEGVAELLDALEK